MTTRPATIYALATAPGRAGIAVVRLSGPATRAAMAALGAGAAVDHPRRAVRARITDPASGLQLDDALALFFAVPASFTGEDVGELHLHGGLAVVAGVLEACAAQEGLRLADPGEFSRRAFDNDKLDLTQAEGLADLIAAETAAQLKQALRQMDGALGRHLGEWRTRLIALSAHLEALIDFPEDDLPPETVAMLDRGLADLAAEIMALLDDGGRGERLRGGVEVAIQGAPNAGKSSLLNALARRDVAIVSDIAGTTRDVLEVHLDLGGYPVTLLDTAGLRESDDPLEREGIQRARARAAAADLRLLVVDPQEAAENTAEDVDLTVWNKADIWGDALPVPTEVLAVSARTGQGMDALITTLTEAVAARFGMAEGALITRARHREALTDVLQSLKRAQEAPLPELAAEDLRLAVRAIGRITGAVAVDDILDVIFGDFCIGK